MPKKHDYIYVKESFELSGYTLLDTVYVNNATPLRYMCPYGHVHTIRFNDWQRGVRCPECRSRIRTYPLKNRINEVRARYSSEGYELLSDNIENSKSVVRVKCPRGHIFKQSVAGWQRGNRCPYCSNRVRLKDKVPEIEKSLLAEDYKFIGFDKGRKLKYACPNGHLHSVRWPDWLKGIRCPYCSGNIKKTISEVKLSFKKEGYTLLTKGYKNCFTRLHYICPEGHERSTTWNDWQQGYRCRLCADTKNSISISGSGHPNWQGGKSFEPYCQDWSKEFKEFIKERDGYKCLNPDCRCNDSRLHVHHIDYNKKNCSLENLVTVCGSCNARANYDREWHKAWYQSILYRRYGYDYN